MEINLFGYYHELKLSKESYIKIKDYKKNDIELYLDFKMVDDDGNYVTFIFDNDWDNNENDIVFNWEYGSDLIDEKNMETLNQRLEDRYVYGDAKGVDIKDVIESFNFKKNGKLKRTEIKDIIETFFDINTEDGYFLDDFWC